MLSKTISALLLAASFASFASFSSVAAVASVASVAALFAAPRALAAPAHAARAHDACAGAAPLAGSAWDGLARAAGNGPSAKSRLEVIRAAAPTQCFSMTQVRFLMETLSSDAALRVDALAALHGRLVEPSRFAELYGILTAEQAEALRLRIGSSSSSSSSSWSSSSWGSSSSSQTPPEHAPPSAASASTREVCYQVSNRADSYSRTPELLCVTPRARGDKQFDLVMKTGLGGSKEVARFSLALLEQSAQRTKNKDHYGIGEAESSTFNTLAIRFDGVRDVTNGDERGTVLIGKNKLYYRSAR